MYGSLSQFQADGVKGMQGCMLIMMHPSKGESYLRSRGQEWDSTEATEIMSDSICLSSLYSFYLIFPQPYSNSMSSACGVLGKLCIPDRGSPRAIWEGEALDFLLVSGCGV